MKDSPSVAKANPGPSHHQLVEWADRGPGMAEGSCDGHFLGIASLDPGVTFKLLKQPRTQFMTGFQQDRQEATFQLLSRNAANVGTDIQRCQHLAC